MMTDRQHLVFSLLRRVGLGAGSFMAVFTYFDQSMDRETAVMIGLGVGLVAFSLPRLRPPGRPPSAPRGFEVVVPEERRD